MSLGLAADTIDAARRSGKPIDPATFDLDPNDIRRLAQRFLTSLATDAHEVWVRRLAVTPRFDEPAARYAFSEHRSVDQDAAWQALVRYSFVRPAGAPGWFAFHGSMRDALNETDGPLDDWHRFWRGFWQTRSQRDVDDWAGLAWYHDYQLNPKLAVASWNERAKRTMRERDTPAAPSTSSTGGTRPACWTRMTRRGMKPGF